MTWIAAAIIGSTAVSVVAADKAASAQESAANKAANTSQAQYDQTRIDQAPWRDAGAWAIGQMKDVLGPGGSFDASKFTSDPGYQFRLSEGQNAIENSAASRGMLLSGATMKALSKYGQDFASNEYQNAFNRLASISGSGQASSNTVAQAGMNNANNVANAQMAYGNAESAGYMGQANAISNAVNSGVNAYGQNQMMKWLKTPTE